MSIGPISRVAAQFERSAPRACILGIRILVVSFLVAAVGFAIASTVSVDLGYVVGACGGIGGLFGIAMYFKGLCFDRKNNAP